MDGPGTRQRVPSGGETTETSRRDGGLDRVLLGAGHPVLVLQRQAGNRAVTGLLTVQRDGPTTRTAAATGPTTQGPAPPPPSTLRPTVVSGAPMPPDLRQPVQDAVTHANATPAGTGAGAGQPGGQGAAPHANGAAPAAGSGGAAPTGRPNLPDTDPIAQGQVMAQWAIPVVGANGDFVPFTLSAQLGFPSAYAIRDWRYHARRTGDVHWWEHLDVIGNPVIGIAVGPSLTNQIHVQPSVGFNLLQYHMTHGEGAAQRDDDIALAALWQPDYNAATRNWGSPVLAQATYTRTEGGSHFFQVFAQGGYDPTSGQWSATVGVGFGFELGAGQSARGR